MLVYLPLTATRNNKGTKDAVKLCDARDGKNVMHGTL